MKKMLPSSDKGISIVISGSENLVLEDTQYLIVFKRST
jgi:hypothetical protein